MDRRVDARRPRLFVRVRAAGHRGDRSPHPGDREARRTFPRVRRADRRAVRRAERGTAEFRARLSAAGTEPERALDAVVLAGIDDPDGIRRLVRHDSDLYRSTGDAVAGAPAALRAGGRGRLP